MTNSCHSLFLGVPRSPSGLGKSYFPCYGSHTCQTQ